MLNTKYMSLPLCLASNLLSIKTYIFEPNSVIGRANKLTLTFAKKVICYDKNLKDISDNYPIMGIKQLLKLINNETYMNRNFKISDKMISEVSDSITKNTEIRELLSEKMYFKYCFIPKYFK